MSKVLIIGNAKQKFLAKWQQLIQSADTIIACDGAISDCYEHDIAVDFLIGDLDSITKQDWQKQNKIILKLSRLMNNTVTI